VPNNLVCIMSPGVFRKVPFSHSCPLLAVMEIILFE
jgi:hypothetical protein